jgi:hypothetical protein
VTGADLRYRLTLVLAELPAEATRSLAAGGDGQAAAVEQVVKVLREKVRLTRNLALALLGFNVGVEAGQILVIALAVPLGPWAQRRQWEPRPARGLSVVVAVVGAVWFVERLFFV